MDAGKNAAAERGSIRPRHDLPGEVRKRHTRFDLLLEVRLGEDCESIPRDSRSASVRRIRNSPHEMRHCTESSLRDEFQRFARLESETILRDVHFDDSACAGADVEAGGWVGRGWEFGERL